MTTALKVIERAFSKAGIRAAETPLSASEVEDGLDVLNDMLSEWGTNDILKGAIPVAVVGDELIIPRFSLGAVKANLAIRMAGEYDRPITQAMAFDASNSLNSLTIATLDLSDVDYPSTLPLGSGNDDEFLSTQFRDFFPEGKKRNF